MILDWYRQALAAVDPETLTADALAGWDGPAPTIIAIGKAAAAMCRGASQALGPVRGVCVTNAPSPVPEGVELLIGDHPIPGPASYRAGKRVLEVAGGAGGACLAFISGGGSALCEHPRPGVEESFLSMVTTTLIDGGASIAEINLVRAHLSALKGGGLASAASGPVDTYLLSDVGPAPPEVIASGPTIAVSRNPEAARQVLLQHGIEVDDNIWRAMSRPTDGRTSRSVTMLGDGLTAAAAVKAAARRDGIEADLVEEWLTGPVEECLDRFLTQAGPGVTVAAGEPTVVVEQPGNGGRNTHAALLAAIRLAGSQKVFAALATDGVDGRSDAAGAIVDGSTLAKRGDPSHHLSRFASADYLRDYLVRTGPSNTNVADLWLLWSS